MQMQTTLRGALAVTALVTLMAAPAQAVVVAYGGPAIAIPQTIDGIYVNVVTGTTGSLGATPGWDFNVYFNNTELAFFTQGDAQPTQGYVGSGTTVAALAPGAIVGPASNFLTTNNTNGGFTNPTFSAPGTNFFGFRFISEATSTTHYGWAQISTGGDSGFPAAILSYAFESTPNTAIAVVPEPGTYALMLAGLAAIAGFAARRRKAD